MMTILNLPLYEINCSPYSGILLAWDLKAKVFRQVQLLINLEIEVNTECVFQISAIISFSNILYPGDPIMI